MNKTYTSSLGSVLKEINDPRITKSVNQFLHKFYIRINSLNSLDKTERIFFMDLLMSNSRQEINMRMDSRVKSHLKNEIVSIYRNKLIVINGTKI